MGTAGNIYGNPVGYVFKPKLYLWSTRFVLGAISFMYVGTEFFFFGFVMILIIGKCWYCELKRNSVVFSELIEPYGTADKIKFSIKDLFSKSEHLHLLKKSLMENFIFCAVWYP